MYDKLIDIRECELVAIEFDIFTKISYMLVRRYSGEDTDRDMTFRIEMMKNCSN